jgi:hypothetical protein
MPVKGGGVTTGRDGKCRVNSRCHAYGGGLGLNALASGGVKASDVLGVRRGRTELGSLAVMEQQHDLTAPGF